MSNINPNNIDGTFPIQGQDNPSQGFRDNFTNIRNNFSYAENELSDLQAKAITTSALTGQTLVNNMNYNQLQYPQLFSPSNTFLNLGTPTGGTTITLDYSQANFQKVTTNGSYSVAFANWPTNGQFGRMTLVVVVTNTSNTLSFSMTSPGVTIGFNEIAGANVNNGIITFDQVGTFAFQFDSTDAGQTIAIRDLSRNYSTLRDPGFYWNDELVSTLFVGFYNGLGNAMLADAGRNTVMTAGSYSSTSFGNLSLANVSYSTLDTGPLAGYNITSARGNLQTLSFLPTQNNDLLGYVNAVTFTGNNSGGYTFSQTGRIDFHATGSNVSAGLGGNIAMYTAVQNNGANPYNVTQAVGIENDQSAHFYGNLFMGQLGSTNANSAYVPIHSTSGGTPGQVAWSYGSGNTFFYICVASNTWQRVQLSSTSW